MDNIDWPHRVLGTGPIAPTEGVDDLASAATRDGGAALDFVRQAAEVIRGIEDRAYETEQHARGIAKEATEKLQLAEKRIEELETCIKDAIRLIGSANGEVRGHATDYSAKRWRN